MARLELVRTKLKLVKATEEYFNSIRTNVQFSGDNIKVIALTSVQPAEGKSTTSTNLAISFANAGFRTLLIDADTRNSIMSGTFKSDSSYKGLTNYLTGNAELVDVIQDTSVNNLNIILSGNVPPNPTSLLQNHHFNTMIELTRDLYDYIIIDTPPIGLVIDAAIIAKQVDATLLVTKAGAIKRRFVKKAIEQMEQSGTPFLGVVLNKVTATTEKYGSYGGYGGYGGYGSYGGETTKKRKRSQR